MLQDHQGNIWLGLWNKGIYRYNPLTGTAKVYRHSIVNSNSLSSDVVNTLIEDNHHNIWAGLFPGGISIYQRELDSFLTYRANTNQIHALTFNQIVKLFEDRSGIIWIETNGAGLNNSYPANIKFNVYRNFLTKIISHTIRLAYIKIPKERYYDSFRGRCSSI